jgi:hypothetical protein
MILFWILFIINTVAIVVVIIYRYCKPANKIQPELLAKSETGAAEDIET